MRYLPLDPRGASLALLISLLWGGSPIAIKLGLVDAPPLRLAMYRFALGGAVVLAWAAATGRMAGFRIERQEWRPLLVLGLMLTFQVGVLNIATALTSAAHVAVLLNSYAVHIVVLAHFLVPGDRMTIGRLAGVLVAYAGIVTLVGGQPAAGTPTLVGDLLAVLSALALAERTVYMARTIQRMDAVKINLAQSLFGLAGFAVLSWLFEPAPTRWTWSLVSIVGYQGAVLAGFNFMVNLWLLKRYRPSTLSAIFLTQPIFGVVLAALVTGDRLTPALLMASAAVAAGIGLASR